MESMEPSVGDSMKKPEVVRSKINHNINTDE